MLKAGRPSFSALGWQPLQACYISQGLSLLFCKTEGSPTSLSCQDTGCLNQHAVLAGGPGEGLGIHLRAKFSSREKPRNVEELGASYRFRPGRADVRGA